MAWSGLGWLVLALGGLGCDDFLDFDNLRCGNGVIEPAADEDCDGLPGGLDYRCGAPGTPEACRLICVAHAECPEGWRCGVAGICAAPTGRFTQAVVTRLDGDAIGLGDLDGDGWLDVVSDQRNALGVAYGRGDGAFDGIEPVPLPLANRRPAVGDADGDGRADVALVEASGVTVLRGTASRTLEPVITPLGPAPSVTRITRVGVSGASGVESVLTVTLGPAGIGFSMVDRALDAAEVEAALDALGVADGASPPTIRAAQLDGGGPSPEEILLTFAGRPEVHLLDLVCAGGSCTLSRRAVLTVVNDLVTFRPGAFGADLNRDGWPDVVVQPREARAAQVAWGSADGFEPLQAVRGLNVGGRGDLRPELSAVVDLEGDERPDLVNGGAILALSGDDGMPEIERVFQPRRPMVAAGVADVDADGALDLYALVDQTVQFALARGQGQYVEVSSGITDVKAVEAADLDGDRFADLVVQRTDGTLLVYFGAPDGSLSAPALIGRLGAEALWVTARLGDGEDDGGLDDDLVVYDDGRVYVFPGSPQRSLATAIPTAARPQGVAIGRFDDGPAIYVGGRDTDSRRADRIVSAEALAGPDPAVSRLNAVGCADALLAQSGTLQVVDWDDDGLSEVLQFDHVERDGQRVAAVQWVAIGAGEARCRMVAHLDALWQPLGFGRADLDGDAADELVAVLAAPAGMGQELRREVAVWSLGADGVGALRMHPAPMVLERGSIVDMGRGPELVVAAEGGLYRVARPDGPEGELAYTLLTAVPAGVVDAASADVDGDGLVDLVLKTPTSVLVHPQGRCSARDAWDGTCSRREAW